MPKLMLEVPSDVVDALSRLGLLRELYGKLIVPTAVWREVVEEGKGRPGVIEVQEARLAGWIEVRTLPT